MRCARGRVLDVVVDLRRGSPTFGEWEALRARRRARPPAVDPGRLRARLLRALRDRRLRLQVHELLRRRDRGGDPLRRPRRRDRVAARTSSCSTPSATAPPPLLAEVADELPFRTRDERTAASRRARRDAAPRQPAHGAAGVAVRALGRRALPRADGGPRPGPRAPGRADEQLDDLRAIGLDWDGEVVFQSARNDAYDAAIERLRADGPALRVLLHARRDPRGGLGAARAAARGRLPGHLPAADRRRAAAQARRGRPPALRVRADGAADRRSRTALLGPLRGRGRRLRRAPQRRRAPPTTSRSIVDDAAQGIGEVVRGADLLDSTPRQLLPGARCSGSPRRRTRTCRSCSGRTAAGWPSATAR